MTRMRCDDDNEEAEVDDAQPEREKDDDDGVEYSDPRDERDERLDGDF